MRRLAWIYVAVLSVVVAVVAAVVAVVWVRGEVHNTHLRTAAHPPPALPLADPSPQLQVAWTTADRAADGTPLWQGTVITLSRHSVRGRDVRTGAVTWSYTRTDRVACSASQVGGLTFAFFRVNGNCDELTVLDSQTGARRWTRTLDSEGHPLNGTPQVALSGDSVMVWTKDVIYDLYADATYSFDRWEYHPDSCTITGAVLGPAGALIAQTCDHPDCSQVRAQFCGSGPQLLLRDAHESRDGDNKKTGRNTDGKNIDQLIWNDLGNDDVPVSAGPVVTALNRTTRALDVLDTAHGTPSGSIAVTPAPASLTAISAVPTTQSVLVQLGGAVHAIDQHERQLWSMAATGAATVVGSDPSQWPVPTTAARVSIVTGAAVVRVDPGTGRALARSGAPSAAAPGAVAYPAGTGYVLTVPGTAGVVVYR
jgi:hypothetical protein